MQHRRWLFSLGFLASAVFVCTPVWAASSHQGKVVSAGDGKLTMTTLEGENQHTHEVAADAVVTCDGNPCGLADVKAGNVVTVTLDQKDEAMVVTKIEAMGASK